MKHSTKILIAFLIIALTSCKKPLDYYNKAVGAGNMAVSLTQMESRLERIQEGFEPEPINLTTRISMRQQINENYLEELKELLGNEASDPMIKAAIAYFEQDVEVLKNPKSIELFNAIDKKLTPDDLQQILNPFEDYLDEIYEIQSELWTRYDQEVSKYAKANNIKENFYGPNLQPIDNKNE